MTIRLGHISAILAGVLLAAVPIDDASAQETAVLRFNRWVPPTHHFHARILAPWAERVQHATAGRVRIEFTPASLGAPSRQFELALSGVADITAGNQTYSPERFVLSRAVEMPFLSDGGEALSVAHWRAQERFFAAANEYKGTKLLAVFNNGPVQIFTAKKPINSVQDLQSLKVRAPGGLPTDVAKALGAVPVAAPITEAYETLSRGIVDGTFLAPDSVRSFNMHKILGYQTVVPLGLYNSAFFVVMNEAKWNALKEMDRQAVMSVSGEALAIEAGRIWDDQDRMANEEFAQSGMKIGRAEGAFAQELRARLKTVEEDWIKLAAQKGVDGAAALRFIRDEVAGYKRK